MAVINDAYNANPASMLAAADVLAGSQGPRRVMIVGDMGELGERSEELHMRVGADIAGRGIDLLIGVGSLGRYIAQAARERGMATEVCASVADAVDEAPQLLRAGDVVLIKASRSAALERLVEPIRAAFDSGVDGPHTPGD